jgi:hypothetical protein
LSPTERQNVPLTDVTRQENARVRDGLSQQIQSKRREGYSSVCDGQHIESDRGSADFILEDWFWVWYLRVFLMHI